MDVFKTIIGHERARNVLDRMFLNNSLPHAILMIGPDHAGKTAIAHALAKRVLSQSGSLGSHMDYLELARACDPKTNKRKSNITVTQIRHMIERLSMTSMAGGYKIAFIKEAHKLSMGAANALLKTLEEPKGNVLFILRAPCVEAVPATITSRCQILRLSFVSRQEMIEGLLCAGFLIEDAKSAAAQSLGRPGLAIRFLKDSQYRNEVQTKFVKAGEFFTAPLFTRFKIVSELLPKSGEDNAKLLHGILNNWEIVLRDLLLDDIGLKQLCSNDDKLIGNLRERLSSDTIINLLERVSCVRAAIPHHINPHLALEHVALGLSCS